MDECPVMVEKVFPALLLVKSYVFKCLTSRFAPIDSNKVDSHLTWYYKEGCKGTAFDCYRILET